MFIRLWRYDIEPEIEAFNVRQQLLEAVLVALDGDITGIGGLFQGRLAEDDIVESIDNNAAERGMRSIREANQPPLPTR